MPLSPSSRRPPTSMLTGRIRGRALSWNCRLIAEHGGATPSGMGPGTLGASRPVTPGGGEWGVGPMSEEHPRSLGEGVQPERTSSLVLETLAPQEPAERNGEDA